MGYEANRAFRALRRASPGTDAASSHESPLYLLPRELRAAIRNQRQAHRDAVRSVLSDGDGLTAAFTAKGLRDRIFHVLDDEGHYACRQSDGVIVYRARICFKCRQRGSSSNGPLPELSVVSRRHRYK